MDNSVRTDLASEAHRLWSASPARTAALSGVTAREETLEGLAGDDPRTPQGLSYALVMGTYAKRRANLALIGMRDGSVSAGELRMACEETLDAARTLLGDREAERLRRLVQVPAADAGDLEPQDALAMYGRMEKNVEGFLRQSGTLSGGGDCA